MKKMTFIYLMILITTISGCVQFEYKHIVGISREVSTYEVVITKNSGGNALQRGAGGAIIGGGVDLLLGGSGTGGAIIGGLAGAATTSGGKLETYREMRTDVNYTVTFDDSTVQVYKNYCPYSVGDSVIKN